MTGISKLILFVFIVFYQTYYAQFKKDCVVTLKGDTVFGEIYLEPNYNAVVRTNGNKIKFEASEVKSACHAGLVFEPLYYNEKMRLYRRELEGDISVYSFIGETFYFKLKIDSQRKRYDLSIKDLKQYSPYYCKPIMDSLMEKKDWTTDILDLIKTYNEQCAKYVATH